MNNIEHDYLKLLKDILDNGVTKSDRTGTGTISIFGRQIRHDMRLGFPLLTTKKMYWKGIVTELLWFLRGDTHLEFLHKHGCHIWDGDAYNKYVKSVKESIDKATTEGILQDTGDGDYNYLSLESFIERIKTDPEFAQEWGELGPIYGKQWRSWTLHSVGPHDSFPIRVDQIKLLIEQLKSNPDSRRLMVSAWNVGELDEMTLPPCHYGFQVYTRELSLEERYVMYFEKLDHTMVPLDIKIPNIHQYFTELNIPTRAISLMWNQRSVDTFLGLPFNIASYGLLLTILAKEVNMVPDQLIGNLGDTHLYLNHLEQAKEQIKRKPFELPKLNQFPTYEGSRPSIESYVVGDFTLKNYQSHESIKAPLSN